VLLVFGGKVKETCPPVKVFLSKPQFNRLRVKICQGCYPAGLWIIQVAVLTLAFSFEAAKMSVMLSIGKIVVENA